MSEKFEGQVVVVVGGTRGLGLCIASTFAAEGARVVVASRTRSSVTRAVEELKARGARAAGMVCDVTDLAKVEALATFALRAFGRVDVWINAAQVPAPREATGEVSSKAFHTLLFTNVLGTYNGSIVALRTMLPREGGKIINLVGDGSGELGQGRRATASNQAWIRRFTRNLAREYKSSAVGVFCLHPGILGASEAQLQVLDKARAGSRLGRLAQAIWAAPPEVAARKALWLAGSATAGWSGLEARVLEPGFVLSRLVLYILTRLSGGPSLALGSGPASLGKDVAAAGRDPSPRKIGIA